MRRQVGSSTAGATCHCQQQLCVETKTRRAAAHASAKNGRSEAAPWSGAASMHKAAPAHCGASCIVPLHLSFEMMWSKDGLLASLLSQHCSNSCSNSGWQIRRAPGSWSAGGTVGRFFLSTTSMTTCSRRHRPQATASSKHLQDDTTEASGLLAVSPAS